MTELIGNWLLNSVRCNIKCTPEILGKACYDGKIFAQILVTYNVCSSDYLKLINQTSSKKAALSNLKKLCVWFKLLGIPITDEFLHEIVNKNGSASLWLLYELFIRLENQETPFYMDSKKMKRVLSESTNKFLVTPVPDEPSMPDVPDEKQYLRDYLNSMKGVMESAENKNLKSFLLNGMKHRAELMKRQIMRDNQPYIKCYTDNKTSFPYLDVQAKINEFENLLASPEGKDNQRQVYKCKPEDYISYLRLKRRKAEADKKLKVKLEKNVMQDAWKQILKNQEIELKNILSMKLLKQSDYEKQMTLRLRRMRLKYQKFIDTRNMVMNMAEKQETVNKFRSSFTAIKNQEMTTIEKQRIKELHHRLFKEKMRIKKMGDVEACRRIVEDTVDFAMIKHDFLETNGMNMPRNKTIELKLLFMKGIRLLPHDLIPITEKYDEDPPIKLDDDRLEELAEYDFYLYMQRIGPWSLYKKEEDPEQLNIIGFIVHRVLDLKYNFHLSTGKPADLPPYNYKIFLQRINDMFALEKLKHYLSKFKIEVFDIFHVFNHFLNSYKLYTGIDTIMESSKTTTSARRKTSPSKFVKKSSKKKFTHLSGVPEKIGKDKIQVDKAVQYPSDEKIVREKNLSSELGEYIYKHLHMGDLLPDSFVCFLIIEYLKTLKDIEGWVLLNYPENITQVAILEYMFTGLEVPYMPKITQNIKKLIESQLEGTLPKAKAEFTISDESSYDLENNMEYETPPEHYSVEELIELKNSNILPRPYPPPEPLTFESFFTKVVLMQREGDRKSSRKSFQKSNDGEESAEEKVTLESFYASQDISSYFHYKYFDATTYKKLLSFILNISASKQNEFFKNIDKGFESIIKPATHGPKESFFKPPKHKRNSLDDWVLKTFLENEEGYLEEMQEEEIVEDEILIFPGHKDWQYTEFPIPEVYIEILATIWESIEYFFTCNMKKCFELLRKVEMRLMPYRNYIRRKAEECLNVEDDRTQAVTNFQLMLNKISDHYRSLDSMKNELHNHILKLQCDLWKMTDVKKFYCEQVSELIYNQNWISGHLISVLQVYCCVLQIEVDRYADTMQLIDDYYSVCLFGKTQEDRLLKIILPKIELKSEKKEDPVVKQSKHQLSSNASKKGKPSSEEKHNKNTMDFDGSKYALCYSDYETLENPALSMLQALISRLTKNITQMKSICEGRCNLMIDRFKELYKPNLTSESNTSRDKLRMSKEAPKRKYMKDLNISFENFSSTTNKVSLEWMVAMDNETKRALYRINLIEKRSSADISEDITIIENTFKDFQKDIISLYHCQMLNVDKVCDLMRAAVEEEVRIQPLVVLRNDTLDIDPSIILFPDAPPPPPSSLVEVSTGLKFTISQLTNLFHKLVYTAPYGIIEQTFALILEDMACIGHETGHSYLPHFWSDLSPDKIKDIIHRLYGNRVIVDWRLFIIFGLDLGYPSLENILEMRKSFKLLDPNFTETANYEQYSCVFLWFENTETVSITQDLYFAKAKELLFQMFRTGENLINYTDFLLAFCRDFDPREGFVKALALAEGCATIAWKQDLFRETFQIEKENEKYNIACGILTTLIAGVYRIVDSVIITDMNEENLDRKSCSTIGLSTIIHKKASKIRIRGRKRKHTYSVSEDHIMGSEVVTEHSEGEEMPCSLDFVEKEKTQILWKSDVYFSTVFSLLLLDIHHFALSFDQIYEPFVLEENLKRIFREKGKGNSMKLFHLLSDPYIMKFFSTYRCFQGFSLPLLLTVLAKDDCSSIVDHGHNPD